MRNTEAGPMAGAAAAVALVTRAAAPTTAVAMNERRDTPEPAERGSDASPVKLALLSAEGESGASERVSLIIMVWTLNAPPFPVKSSTAGGSWRPCKRQFPCLPLLITPRTQSEHHQGSFRSGTHAK